jgi:tRNA U38,U39,U40 pseudouridine synthase TruA
MPRVWMALFFGYNGTNFNGMQHQKEEHIATV